MPKPSRGLHRRNLQGRNGYLLKLRPAILLIVATLVFVGLAQWALPLLAALLQSPSASEVIEDYNFSWAEYFHIAIPIAVLVMELYVIWKMAQEAHERERTVTEFRELTSHARRAEYMLSLADIIGGVVKEARFTSATMEVSSRSDGQRRILETVRVRRKEGKYSHRGLIAKTQKTLPGAIELGIRAEHIEIRLSEIVALSRLRFFVRDEEECVIGVAEGQPDLDDAKESTQSVRIRSRMMAGALEVQFDSLWEKATTLKDYMDELLMAAMPITKAEVRTWFSAIQCKPEELDKALSDNSTVYNTLAEIKGASPPATLST